MKIYLHSTDQPARFEASNERGHTVVIEGSSKFGGKDTAPSPIELLVMSQAGCTAIDVVTMLKKMKQPIQNLEIISEVFRTPGQIPNIINTPSSALQNTWRGRSFKSRKGNFDVHRKVLPRFKNDRSGSKDHAHF